MAYPDRSAREYVADRHAEALARPWPGAPVFMFVIAGSLAGTMAAGTLATSVLAAAWSALVSPILAELIAAVAPVPALATALLWAFDTGLLALLSIVPFVTIFFLILVALQTSGYLSAAAVLTERLLSAFGLPGRTAVPILAATTCNVPAIYGTRVLTTARERTLASFLVVLTPCSARSAVVVAALAPFAGPGAALAAFGAIAIIAVAAGVAANAVMPGRRSAVNAGPARLRIPAARAVARQAWSRTEAFVRTAVPLMLGASFGLGLAYASGALALVQGAIAPAVGALLGLPAVSGVALLLGVLRKELAIQLLLVLAIEEYGADASSLGAFMTPPQLFVYAVIAGVSVPCTATLATIASELGWRSAAAIAVAIAGVALLSGAILARLTGVA